MEWISVLLSIFKSRREREREAHAEDRQEVQDALTEWRALYDTIKGERAALACRVSTLEVQQFDNAAEIKLTKAELAAQTHRLQACLDECKECHESRDELKREVEELKRQFTGREQ
jgi:chromosome segregation ATPase